MNFFKGFKGPFNLYFKVHFYPFVFYMEAGYESQRHNRTDEFNSFRSQTETTISQPPRSLSRRFYVDRFLKLIGRPMSTPTVLLQWHRSAGITMRTAKTETASDNVNVASRASVTQHVFPPHSPSLSSTSSSSPAAPTMIQGSISCHRIGAHII